MSLQTMTVCSCDLMLGISVSRMTRWLDTQCGYAAALKLLISLRHEECEVAKVRKWPFKYFHILKRSGVNGMQWTGEYVYNQQMLRLRSHCCYRSCLLICNGYSAHVNIYYTVTYSLNELSSLEFIWILIARALADEGTTVRTQGAAATTWREVRITRVDANSFNM